MLSVSSQRKYNGDSFVSQSRFDAYAGRNKQRERERGRKGKPGRYESGVIGKRQCKEILNAPTMGMTNKIAMS